MVEETRSILPAGALRFFPSRHSPPPSSAIAAATDRVGRIPELDGLRGLAILSVLFWHYGHYYAPAPGSIGAWLPPLLRLAWSGVDLFFVLSGFLIGGILIANRKASNYWRVFYVRRACRIFPLYFVVLAAFVLATATITPQPSNWLLKQEPPFWNYPLFLQNLAWLARSSFGSDFLGPTWSLAVEEQFYLVLPFCRISRASSGAAMGARWADLPGADAPAALADRRSFSIVLCLDAVPGRRLVAGRAVCMGR